MVDPAPKTSPAAFRKAAMAKLQACTQRGVVVLLQTDSINQLESIDGRYGSWQGGLQRNMDASFPVPSVQALLKTLPTPVVPGLEAKLGYKLKPLSFESHLSRTTTDVANTFGLAPTGRAVGFNYSHGRGLQSTNQSAGMVRTQISTATAMECYVATQKVGDSYKVTVDGVEIANVTSTSNVRKWRKHEKIGMPLTEHTMVVTFVAGTCLFDAIDHHVGTERRGVRIVNAGRTGVSLNSFAKTGPASNADQNWAEVHPLLADDQVSGVDIGILSLATNNMGDPESAFELMLDEYVARFQEVNKNGLLYIMFPAQPNAIPANGDDWPGKHRAARRIANKYANVAVESLWAGDTPGRIPRIENTVGLIKGLHPLSKLLLGDLLPYGYAKTSAAILDQSIYTGQVPDPGEEEEDDEDTGGPVADKTPPAVTLITGDNLTVNPDGTFTFAADITDVDSPIGLAVVRSTAGDLLGNMTQMQGSRYELTLTWLQLRAFLGDIETALRWFVVAYDSASNRKDTGAQNLTVALRTTESPKPVIENVTATGFDVPGSDITISADVSHASGIELVPVNIEGKYAQIGLKKPATGIRWSGTFERSLFAGGDDYALGALSYDDTAIYTARLPYVLASTAVDVTAPTGRMTKPVTGTTLPDSLDLEAYAVDTGAGMRKVEFFVDQVLIADGAYTSQGLFSAPVTLQQIRDSNYKVARIRARLEDRAGNFVFTDWVTFSVPDAPVVVQGAVLPMLLGDSRLPGDTTTLAAWDARFGGVGGSLIQDTSRPWFIHTS